MVKVVPTCNFKWEAAIGGCIFPSQMCNIGNVSDGVIFFSFLECTVMLLELNGD